MDKHQTISEFLERLSGKDTDLPTVVFMATDLKDAPELREASRRWLQADQDVVFLLEKEGFKFGKR
jgi:hypothetical protein